MNNNYVFLIKFSTLVMNKFYSHYSLLTLTLRLLIFRISKVNVEKLCGEIKKSYKKTLFYNRYSIYPHK